MFLVLQSIAHIALGFVNWLKVATQEYTGGYTVVVSNERALEIEFMVLMSA